MKLNWTMLFFGAVATFAFAVGSHATPAPRQVIALGSVVQTPLAVPSASPSASPITTHGMSLVGIQFPAALTSTTITFQISSDCSTYVPLYNSGGAVSYTVAASRFYAINPADFYGATCIRPILGTSEAGARTLTAILKGM